MSHICLNMIVKNEAAVIRRCLATVKPWVDYWVIVDTGSSDGTQDIVRDCMQGVPGELHERPWCNFGHNRSEALDLAKAHGDYLLFIDADEVLRMPEGFRWPTLTADGYRLRCEYGGWHYLRSQLIATRLPWRWQGVLHEYLTCDLPHAWQLLPGPEIVVAHDGARARDPHTYLRDIEVLERALQDEPGNGRYVFYLAQSYRDAAPLAEDKRAQYQERAIAWFRRRVEMGGWDEEVWFSVYQIAVIGEAMGIDAGEVSRRYLAAYQLRPTRAEPLHQLARFHRLRGEYALAHLYARQAIAIAYPQDTLFVDASVYAWRALDELSVAAYYLTQPQARAEGITALEKLWAERQFPESERERIVANRAFYGMEPAPDSASQPADRRSATASPFVAAAFSPSLSPYIASATAISQERQRYAPIAAGITKTQGKVLS